MSNSSGNEGQKQLRSRTLESVADAVDAFGEDHGLLVCYIRRPSQMLSKIPCFTIPEGYHALVLRGGKDMDFSGKGCADDVGNSRSGRATWPAGLHWGVPWLRAAYLVTKQSVVYRCDVKQCVTRDNVPVKVHAAVMFRVRGDVEKDEDSNLVRKFVYECGVRGLEAQLANTVEEGVRVMVRAIMHQKILELTSGGGRKRDHDIHDHRRQHHGLHVSHLVGAPSTIEPALATASVATHDEAANRSTIKRTQVAPEPSYLKESAALIFPSTTAFSDSSIVGSNTDPSMSTFGPAVSGDDNGSDISGDDNATTVQAIAPVVDGVASASRVHSASTVAGEDSVSTPSSPPRQELPPQLPAIHRGLRASRIVPSEFASAREASTATPPTRITTAERRPVAAGGVESRTRTRGSQAPAPSTGRESSRSSVDLIGDRRRVHPTELFSNNSRSTGENNSSSDSNRNRDRDRSRDRNSDSNRTSNDNNNGDDGATPKSSHRSSWPPIVTNLDLSPSPSLSEKDLPTLDIGITTPSSPVPSLGSRLASPSSRMSTSEEGRAGEDRLDGGVGDRNRRCSGRHGHDGGGDKGVDRDVHGGDTNGVSECPAAELAAAAAAVATGTAGEVLSAATEGKYSTRKNSSRDDSDHSTEDIAVSNVPVGRRSAEQLRDRLNRTLMPQGIEVTTVLIRSTELPPDIAAQMSGVTLNVSLGEQQRAVKSSEEQKVRHEDEALALRQQCQLERALAMREGDEEVEKAKIRLMNLRARAMATTLSISARSAVVEQCVASHGDREVTRRFVRETAEESSKACLSDRVAGIVGAEAEAFRIRREAAVNLEMVQNDVKAQEVVDAAEGEGARMLRAARTYTTKNKGLEVWKSLVENDLALITTSPLVSKRPSCDTQRAVSTTSRRGEAATNTAHQTTTVREGDGGIKGSANPLTSVLLGEAGFKRAQMLGLSPMSSSLSRKHHRNDPRHPRCYSKERMELKAQMLFVKDLTLGKGMCGTRERIENDRSGPTEGRPFSPGTFSSFSVWLDQRFSPKLIRRRANRNRDTSCALPW